MVEVRSTAGDGMLLRVWTLELSTCNVMSILIVNVANPSGLANFKFSDLRIPIAYVCIISILTAYWREHGDCPQLRQFASFPVVVLGNANYPPTVAHSSAADRIPQTVFKGREPADYLQQYGSTCSSAQHFLGAPSLHNIYTSNLIKRSPPHFQVTILGPLHIYYIDCLFI